MNEENTGVTDPQTPTVAALSGADDEAITQEEQANRDASSTYTSDNIKYLKDADHIRQRPGMYIGDTGPRGMHHLIYELVHNCVDEALAGYCHHIHVKLHIDNSVSVSDDGRGIPVEPHPQIGKSTLEAVLTMVGAGAKFDKGAYKVSAGLHGMGAKAVTALSEWVEAQVQRNGRTYMQEYVRGKATTEVKDIGPSKRSGTRITFKPDPEIFHDAAFDHDTLEVRFRELAFLNKGLAIRLTDERSNKDEVFKYDGGIAQFVEYLNRDEEKLHKPIYLDKTVDGVRVEVAMQYTNTEEERYRCYTNNAYNAIGGTHLSGFRTALTRTFNAYGTKEELFKNLTLIGEDFREGLTVIVSVQHPDPQFDSQPKNRLNNLEVEGIVAGVVSEHLAVFLEENPKDAQRLMKKAALAAEGREAAAKAKKALRDRKSILSGGGLPGKLMDCTTKERDDSELFLVEGQSAGGTAESGRDRFYQAILPLRGKVLNVEKARPEKLLANEEICNLISAVGVDIGGEGELDRLRYGKIIILTDADVDGQHIRTLLLTFFYRQMSKLVEQGHIYVARPPLYKVTQKKEVRYVHHAEDMQRELMERGLRGTRLTVLALPDEGTTPGRPERVFANENLEALLKILLPLEDALQLLERRGINLTSFLARATEQGLPTHRVILGGHEEWFYTADAADAYRRSQQEQLGHELMVADETLVEEGNGHAASPGETFTIQELHEVRAINRYLDELRKRGLRPSDLVLAPRIAGRDPLPRFRIEHDEQAKLLPQLRELINEIRHYGEKGLSITRFKGLGEMDAEELWDTTLDPKRRTLLRVQLDDALKADEMFRTLMGEKVEPRRDFIYGHALDVKDIDYHGA